MAAAGLLVALGLPPVAYAGHLVGEGATYTTNADFEEGSLVNLETADGSLRLKDSVDPFDFIWIAVSTKGTVVKVDTATGQIVGEYLSAPAGRLTDPSRTTVDQNGNVWVANRAENGSLPANGLLRAGASGSAIHIGLEQNGQCVDRNGNGVIDTSHAQGDIKPWPNTGGADNTGGVSTATDECVLHYVRVNSTGTRHLSVTDTNDVWVSGTGERAFDLVDGDTGTIVRAELPVNCGGYGGLIDRNGVIWSAQPLLRWNTALPLTVANSTCYTHDSYGLGIDSQGNVWNTSLYNNQVRKFAPDGTLIGTFDHGNANAQGVAVDANDHVWVAHAFFGSTTLGHLLPNGDWLGNVTVGTGPTGVAVDGAGKIWATNYNSRTASRIDPSQGPLVTAGGATYRLGVMDLETLDLGGNPYNYSDMTGSVVPGAPGVGTWAIVHDSGQTGHVWDVITYNATIPGALAPAPAAGVAAEQEESLVTITAASSADGVTFSPPQVVTNGGALALPDGRYLRVVATLRRAAAGVSPLLHDVTIGHKSSLLSARPAVAQLRRPGAGLELFFPDLAATLSEPATGLPIAGRSVSFYATDPTTSTRTLLCTATTGSDGVATCSGLDKEVAAVLGLGYEVEFAGDTVYGPSSDEGSVVVVEADIP